MALHDANARGLTLTETLAIHHIPDDGLTFDESLDSTWIDDTLGINQGATAYHCEAGPRAHLDVQPMGAVASSPPILVRGTVTASLRSTCVRCLADVTISLSVRIEQMLFARSSKEPDREDSSDLQDNDEGTYTHEGVDLPNVVREAMLLEIAMNPSCGDEAACDVRTNALIEDVNARNRVAIDPRWEALQALLEKKPN